MSLEMAIAFIRVRADTSELARLAYLTNGTPPPAEVVAQLLGGQRADGGWPAFWALNYSALDATCFRLAQAEPLGLLGREPALERALLFLARRQQPDGSFAETPPPTVQPPPWLTPGNPAATRYLTANCGLWLAHSSDTGAARRAAAWLLQTPPAREDLPPTLWLAAALLMALGEHAAAEDYIAALARPAPELPAASLAWALTSMALAKVPAEHWFIARAANALRLQQRPDGGWASADGPERDVHVTLEALRALQW